jgi:hypothetical protein
MGIYGVPQKPMKFHVDKEWERRYKDLYQKRLTYQMDHVFIYGYVGFALGILSLVFLIRYSWRTMDNPLDAR